MRRVEPLWHPSQAVLDRLKAANSSIKLYRTDLHGEITLNTRGKQNDVAIKAAKEPAEDLWVGRLAQKDRLVTLRLHRVRRFWSTTTSTKNRSEE